MKTRVQTWGNGLVVRIPKFIVSELDLHSGDLVELFLVGSPQRIDRCSPVKYSLKEMLGRVTDDNIHDSW